MKVLVIPDVHLKPWMFVRTSELMNEHIAERAVCLMDIADEWKQQFNLDLYIETYDAAIAFAKAFSDTLWCYGNHDSCYVWNKRESGYSSIAGGTVNEKLVKLKNELPDEHQLAFIHRIDNVLFMHGGLTDEFVRKYVPEEDCHDADRVTAAINGFGADELWQELSPLWYRPQLYSEKLYQQDALLQVVGHTPVRAPEKTGNVLSCDVFSFGSNGHPYGSEEFVVLDTKTWEYEAVR